MASESKGRVSASSLAELKAELARKQEELRKDRLQSTSGYARVKSVPKKPTLWSKQNAGVLQRAQKDLIEKQEEDDEMEKSRRALAAKTKKYEKMMSSNSIPDDEENETYLVDFQKKVVDRILDNQEKQRDEAKRKQKQDEEETKRLEEEERKLLSDIIPEPDNPDEQWVDYVDSFGRSRRCLRKDLPHLIDMDKKLHPQVKNRTEERQKQEALPDLMSQDMYREKLRQKWEQEEQEALEKPAGPVHYANVQHDEIRTHGVGYYQFAKDEQAREEQLEQLSNLRNQTVELRAKKEKLKEKRKAIMEARLAKVKQRKMIREGNNEAAGMDRADPDDDLIGPKPSERTESEKAEPEPEMLVRDDAWRKDAPQREWDKGKKVIDDWRAKTFDPRDERLPEFAPPQMYFTESKKSDIAFKGNTKSRKNDKLTFPLVKLQGNPTIADQVEEGLKELRNATSSQQMTSHFEEDVSSIPLPSDETGTSPSVIKSKQNVDVEKITPRTSVCSAGNFEGLPYAVNDYIQNTSCKQNLPQSNFVVGTTAGAIVAPSHQNIPPVWPVDITQPPPASYTMPQGTIPELPDRLSSNPSPNTVNVDTVQQEINHQQTVFASNSDAIKTHEQPFEKNWQTDEKPIDRSAQVLKGTVHYSSKAVKYEVPQLPKPKYERVDLMSVPLNLPAPPSAGQSIHYPSQEEVISRKKDKETESINSWKRQFNYKPELHVGADSIPFPAPNVQRDPQHEKSEDSVKFDPSKPPPNM